MISLKRNRKGTLVKATGLRSRQSTIYEPGQTTLFKISRSKFTDFLACRRCFYLDRVKGIISPSIPGWTLNDTVDLLLKREFDTCRVEQIQHRLFEQFGLENIVPFQHESIDYWRDSLHGGLRHHLENTNIVLYGGIDDIWFDSKNGNLIIVDYKSQASPKSVSPETYLSGFYKQGFKIQLDFYAYLLTNMGFDVSQTSYFYVCNADRSASTFSGQLKFQETLVPYQWSIAWIDFELAEMVTTLNSYDIPEPRESCENCAYSLQRASFEAFQ